MSDELARPNPLVEDPISFSDLLDRGLNQLRDAVGPRWKIETVGANREQDYSNYSGSDLLIQISDPSNSIGQVLVECKLSLSPTEASKVLEVQRRTLRNIYSGEYAALVISTWLSPRAREILEARNIGYVDLTGNINFRLERPGLVIITQGAQEDPKPGQPGTQRRLSGQKALRLIRLLTDVVPPYRTTELAEATGLSAGYVSRLLDVMQRQALIVRKGRLITQVDWPALIRARASESELLDLDSISAIASNGIPDALDMISQNSKLFGKIAVTGSYAMGPVPSITIGGQLIFYVDQSYNPQRLIDDLGLLPAQNGDVILLTPGDPVVFERMRVYSNIPLVELSQLAIDCLSGPGRMPADGEEVLRFMIENEPSWRTRDIQSLRTR